METEIVTPEFSGLIFHADPAWVQENGGVVPATTGFRFLPHEVDFCDAEQHVVRTLRDIYQEIAMEVDRRGETEARQSHPFDAPTFLRLPSGASMVKVTGLSVDVTIRKELQERLWTAPNVVTFILKNLDDENTTLCSRPRGVTPQQLSCLVYLRSVALPKTPHYRFRSQQSYGCILGPGFTPRVAFPRPEQQRIAQHQIRALLDQRSSRPAVSAAPLHR
jgi:hypothetical protein